AQGRVGQGRHRGRGGPGIGRVGLGGGDAGVDTDPRAPDHGGRRGDARRVPAVRDPAGPAAVRTRTRSGVGPDRLPVRRHGPAAGPEPAAGAGVGEAAAQTAGVPLSRFLFFAAVGAYAVGGEMIDLVLLIIGLIGFGMRRCGLPVLPAVIGVVLGPAAEQQLRRALQISDGSVTGLVNTPFSVTVYAVVVLLLVWPQLRRAVVRRRTGRQPGRRRRTDGG